MFFTRLKNLCSKNKKVEAPIKIKPTSARINRFARSATEAAESLPNNRSDSFSYSIAASSYDSCSPSSSDSSSSCSSGSD